ncbi:hypothetical protein Tco_0225348 [Tanacetum coccineum]
MDQVTKHNSMQGTNDYKRKFDDRRTFTNNNIIEGKKPSRLMLSPQLKTVDLEQGGSSDQKLQKQRASHWKQPTTSIHNFSCLRRERALQKSVLKSKQQCPWKSILAERQERSPRSKRSHGYVLSKPTSS